MANLMAERFGLNQTSEPRTGKIYVPGCGSKTQDNAPIIYIEFEANGNPVMYIWADISQEVWTHRIELKDALESNREE